MKQRLQKVMAQAGLGSRRESEQLIAAGRVRLNDRVAHLGDKADPLVDRIEIDGRPIASPSDLRVYVKLYKPRGVISSLSDELEADRPVVRELVPLSGHLYPVGRLDKQSEGLILMTNDGDLAHRLTHPSYEHEKVYEVTLEGCVAEPDLNRWREGVTLDGRLTVPADIEVLKRSAAETTLRVTLREGRKRQIRRVATALGHPVLRLVRIRIGTLELGDLSPGEWRYLSKNEVRQLQETVRRPAQQNKLHRRRAS